MSRQTRGEWMEAHPWLGAVVFCAVIAAAMALYVVANGLSVSAALAGAIPGWAVGTVVMAKLLQRSAERRRA